MLLSSSSAEALGSLSSTRLLLYLHNEHITCNSGDAPTEKLANVTYKRFKPVYIARRDQNGFSIAQALKWVPDLVHALGFLSLRLPVFMAATGAVLS